jgi:hypothetical protein
MTNKSQLLEHIRSMEGHEVKALVVEWLVETEGGWDDLGRMVDGQAYGAIDREGNFQVLSEDQMAAESLRVLEEYRRDREGVSHDRVGEWLDSVGSENPLPCPQ